LGKKTVKPDVQLDELRELVDDVSSDGQEPTKKTDRRSMLRLAGAALLGAAGAAAVRVVPAAAASGNNMIVGCLNTETTTTQLSGSTTNGQIGMAVDAAIAIQGRGDAATAADSVGVLGTTKSGSGIGVHGSASAGIGGLFETGSLSTTKGSYDLSLGTLSSGSGRLAQLGRTDVGGTSPNWNPNFVITNSLTGATTFQHELVRGNDGSIWASRALRVRSGIAAHGRWKRVNTVRTDTADGLGSNFKPFRLIDTRTLGAAKAAGSVTTVTAAGTGSGASTIPADAIAVMGNLTAVNYTGPGFLAIMPAGIVIGTATGDYNPAADPSSVNFIVGQAAIANSFVCGLHNGQLQVYVGDSASQFIIDITAYLE
jgi:hypothetical protein